MLCGASGRAVAVAALVLAEALVSMHAAGQCSYEVTVIAREHCSTYGLSLNEHGQVVGYSSCGPAPLASFSWSSELGLVNIPPPEGFAGALATGVNNAGQIVISTTADVQPPRGFVYDDGKYTLLPPVSAGWSDASSINDNGQVAGQRSIGDDVNPLNAFVWSSSDGFDDVGLLGTTQTNATAINDVGEIAGRRGSSFSNYEAFVWTGEEVTFLGTVPGGTSSSANDISDDGTVVGAGLVPLASQEGLGRFVAFSWSSGEFDVMPPLPGVLDCAADAINIRGHVVGGCANLGVPDSARAFLWHNGRVINLNDLVDLELDFVLERAVDVNDRGQILAQGRDPAFFNLSFLLTPRRTVGDVDLDCRVGMRDLLLVLTGWNDVDSPADVNDDGIVDDQDLAIVIEHWSRRPPDFSESDEYRAPPLLLLFEKATEAE